MSSGTGDKVKGRMEKAAGELLDDDRLRDRGVNAVKDAVTGRPRDKRPPR